MSNPYKRTNQRSYYPKCGTTYVIVGLVVNFIACTLKVQFGVQAQVAIGVVSQ